MTQAHNIKSIIEQAPCHSNLPAIYLTSTWLREIVRDHRVWLSCTAASQCHKETRVSSQ